MRLFTSCSSPKLAFHPDLDLNRSRVLWSILAVAQTRKPISVPSPSLSPHGWATGSSCPVCHPNRLISSPSSPSFHFGAVDPVPLLNHSGHPAPNFRPFPVFCPQCPRVEFFSWGSLLRILQQSWVASHCSWCKGRTSPWDPCLRLGFCLPPIIPFFISLSLSLRNWLPFSSSKDPCLFLPLSCPSFCSSFSQEALFSFSTQGTFSGRLLLPSLRSQLAA